MTTWPEPPHFTSNYSKIGNSSNKIIIFFRAIILIVWRHSYVLKVLLDKRNKRCFLQEPAFITQIPTHRLGSVSRYTLKAACSEWQNGLMNYFDALSDFILLNDERWCQPNDITVRGFGEKSVITKPQAHLPSIIICNLMEKVKHGVYATAEKVAKL